ncbi:MAG TPA: bifunctional riboflavin kinase/FAD synthetase [Lachnospiraceae bacterium]|nr:bifunctional riboflavin kinase/FAD synthetase [Lachnospiraceae bacterium]
MVIITGTADICIEEETAVAIGKFDGIHIGHRRLLQEILDQRMKGRRACVFTFDPAPSVFFGGGEEKELTTREEKRRLFEFLGIDLLIEFPLNKETASIPPQVFIRDVLCNRMNTVFIAAGEDLTYGMGGAGNASLLEEMSGECGLEVAIIQKIQIDGQKVSSTLVREAVGRGDMPYAESLLGMPYTVSGIVQHGNHIGHSLGMPTLNLIPSRDKLLPPKGVYFSRVMLDGKWYKGISNIGLKPTVQEDFKVMGVETYLYDFNGDAYGKEIEVSLFAFKRKEQKFSDLEQLKLQLKEDLIAGAAYSH